VDGATLATTLAESAASGVLASGAAAGEQATAKSRTRELDLFVTRVLLRRGRRLADLR
jgi:hypothetical protein